MSKAQWEKLVGATGRMLLAFALVFSQASWAGQNQQTKEKAASLQKHSTLQVGEKQSSAAATAKAPSKQAQVEESESSVAEEKSPGDGRHEGIKVHGHWTIEVRNPDGTVVTHREFENSLQFTGQILLANLLSRTQSPGLWGVFLDGPNVPVPGGLCGRGGGTECDISEPQAPFPDSRNLVVSAASGIFTLSGSVVVSSAGTVAFVSTIVGTCIPSVAPSACPTATGSATINGYQLTSAGVSPVVSVAAGQTIAVTVVISFS